MTIYLIQKYFLFGLSVRGNVILGMLSSLLFWKEEKYPEPTTMSWRRASFKATQADLKPTNVLNTKHTLTPSILFNAFVCRRADNCHRRGKQLILPVLVWLTLGDRTNQCRVDSQHSVEDLAWVWAGLACTNVSQCQSRKYWTGSRNSNAEWWRKGTEIMTTIKIGHLSFFRLWW